MDTLVTANHLGVITKQQFKLVEAEGHLLRALEGLAKIESEMPANALLYAEAAYNYAVLCVQLGKRRSAAKYFGIAHKRLESSLGAENAHTLDALHWEIKCTKDVDFVPTVASISANASSSASSHKDGEEEFYLSKPTWVNAPSCELCNRQFTTLTMVRPHHCRICVRTVCDQCSKGKTVMKEFGLTTPVRCCEMCEQQGF